jgi:predicted nucleic acid-binding protein
MRKNHSIYFDSCIYIAFYRQEVGSYGQDRIDAINEAWKENERGGQTIVTSSLAICEVEKVLLEHKLEKELQDFQNRFQFALHKAIDPDPVICDKAARYRDFYFRNPIKRPTRDKPYCNLQTPDAIHLATAKLNGCGEVWTFDGLHTGKDKWESIKMLWLDNKVAGEPLLIVAPVIEQPPLPLG